jgi:hypothetical protein
MNPIGRQTKTLVSPTHDQCLGLCHNPLCHCNLRKRATKALVLRACEVQIIGVVKWHFLAPIL